MKRAEREREGGRERGGIWVVIDIRKQGGSPLPLHGGKTILGLDQARNELQNLLHRQQGVRKR